MQFPPSAHPLRCLPTDRLPPAALSWIRSRSDPPGHDPAVSPAAPEPEPVSAYIYDLDVASGNAARLQAALPAWAEIFYAVKANGFPPVLEALGRIDGVDGFEVASVHEIALARGVTGGAGRPTRLVASGPGKSTPLLAALAEAAGTPGSDVTVNVESMDELQRLNHVASRLGRRITAALRVNPARVALTGSLLMGGTASPFGIPEADVPDALNLARSLPWVDVAGFHVHAVCGNLDAAAHLAYVRWCLGFSLAVAAAHGIDLRIVNVGGGLGVPFEPDRRGEHPFDLDVFAAGLRAMQTPDGVRMLFEPGRWLVADCGSYVAEVTDIKHSHGEDFLVLRGGIHHFQLPASWDIVHNFGVVAVDRWPYAFPRRTLADRPVTVVGELCTPEDTLARDVTVDTVRVGDVVVFPMAGAYGYEFAMHDFLGHPLPDRVAVSRVRHGR